MESCVCDAVKDSCKWCCRSKSDVNKTCRPYRKRGSKQLYLPDGMPCLQGSCHKGVCERQVHDTIQRLWDIIENITVDRLVMFMRANIVGTVIILSLIIWIPASCIVAYINNDLVRDDERSQLTIRRSNRLKVRRPAKNLYIPPR